MAVVRLAVRADGLPAAADLAEAAQGVGAQQEAAQGAAQPVAREAVLIAELPVKCMMADLYQVCHFCIQDIPVRGFVRSDAAGAKAGRPEE